MTQAQWSTPEEEAQALSRAVGRAGCVVQRMSTRETAAGARACGTVSCPDGWAAARLLLALSIEDSKTSGARDIALELRVFAIGDDQYARAVHDYVKDHVRFVRESGEVFTRSDYTLAMGAGDCDDHARLAYALLRAGGVPARLAYLYKPGPAGKLGPAHVLAQAYVGGGWRWLETTVDARFDEPPLVAARRLGVLRSRTDIASEVRPMNEKELGTPMATTSGMGAAEGFSHADARAALADAYRDTFGAEPSEGELDFGQATAFFESGYGRAKGQFANAAAEGNINWGAMQKGTPPCPAGFWEGKDGGRARCFYGFSTDREAAAAFLRTWGKADTLAAARENDATGVARAMKAHGYYEGFHVPPGGIGPNHPSPPFIEVGSAEEAEAANVADYAAALKKRVATVRGAGGVPEPSPGAPGGGLTGGASAVKTLAVLGVAAGAAWWLIHR